MVNTKYRHELKYLISSTQATILSQRLSGIMKLDSHVGESGKYLIRSLYFDTVDDKCFYDNLSGVDPREKYRIRIYNNDLSRISLECKRKERGMTLKNSCLLTESQYERITHGDFLPEQSEMPWVLRKLTTNMRLNRMRPVVIVEYDRIPYVYQTGNVRITIDTDLSSSCYLERFFDSEIPKRPVMPFGMHLLEVKYDSLLPDSIYRAIQVDDLQQTAYSKYFLCRKYQLLGKER